MKKIKNNALLVAICLSITGIRGAQPPHKPHQLDQAAITTFVSDSLTYTPQEHLQKITSGYLGKIPAEQLKQISAPCKAYSNIINNFSILRQEIFNAQTQERINNIILSVIEDIDANYQLYKESKQ